LERFGKILKTEQEDKPPITKTNKETKNGKQRLELNQEIANKK